MPEPMPCDPPVTITVFDVPDIFRSPSRDLKVNEAIGRKAWPSLLPFAISCSDRCRGIVPCDAGADHLPCGANAIQDPDRIMGRSGSPRTHSDGGRSAAQAPPQRPLHFAPRRPLRGGEGGLRLCCLAANSSLFPHLSGAGWSAIRLRPSSLWAGSSPRRGYSRGVGTPTDGCSAERYRPVRIDIGGGGGRHSLRAPLADNQSAATARCPAAGKSPAGS